MTSTTVVREAADEQAQLALGEALAAAVAGQPGVVYLRGELGAGKTTLVRGLLRGLGHAGAVRSPTYTLLEPYEGVTPAVAHLDLYRLADPEELELIGLRDLLDGEALILVEWPERGEGVLPPADLEIRIEHVGSGRRLTLTARPSWKAVLNRLSA